jgi:O-antigen/teichoic acid export membrane protein
MKTIATEPAITSRAGKREATHQQIRGSSLLLAGKLLSLGMNFVAQVLIVRYLATSAYGAWAYALSVVAFCQSFATLGLDRAITRFVPIYHEKEEYGKLFGTVLLVIGTILLTGFAAIAAFHLAPEQLAQLLAGKQQSLVLLLILIFLVPVEALDGLLIGLFASFSSPRAIFFRKHVLGPGLKVGVVLLLILWQADVIFLAYGYLVASAIGVLVCLGVLIRLWRRQGLWRRLQVNSIALPIKEIFAFTIPLMSSDLLAMLMNSVSVMLLGYFHNTTAVAFFRVVLPAADMNKTVMMSFALLYTPLAARLFAKADYAGINELYWRTAVWMAVLSFPIFAVTFSLAQPLTVFLYGARYEQAGVIMALLSLGYYFSAALGFNGLTLKVLGKLRYVVVINLLATAVSVALNLLLIPRYGALGAAVATSATMIVHNVFKQAGLRLVAGISLFDRKYFSFYLVIAASAFALLGLQQLTASRIHLALALAGLASLLVLAVSKKNLAVAETFPELLKLPLMRRLLA